MSDNETKLDLKSFIFSFVSDHPFMSYSIVLLFILVIFMAFYSANNGITVEAFGIKILGNSKYKEVEIKVKQLEKEKEELQKKIAALENEKKVLLTKVDKSLQKIRIKGNVQGDESVFPVDVYFITTMESLKNPGEFFLDIPKSEKGKLVYSYYLGKSRYVTIYDRINLTSVVGEYRARTKIFEKAQVSYHEETLYPPLASREIEDIPKDFSNENL